MFIWQRDKTNNEESTYLMNLMEKLFQTMSMTHRNTTTNAKKACES